MLIHPEVLRRTILVAVFIPLLIVVPEFIDHKLSTVSKFRRETENCTRGRLTRVLWLRRRRSDRSRRAGLAFAVGHFAQIAIETASVMTNPSNESAGLSHFSQMMRYRKVARIRRQDAYVRAAFDNTDAKTLTCHRK
jgi:hypothetical protein